ncbi:MAG TPA: hypothetical protein VFL87_08045 [Thermoleophilaceae bacterium]|nr:hypothetical protein [Thermoleophilaceae bacterium]
MIEDHERERFAGTSADTGEGVATTTRRDASTHAGDGAVTTTQRDASTQIEHDADGSGRTSAYGEGRMAAHEPGREADFQEGQADESRDNERGGLFGRFRRRKADDREPAHRA